VFRNKYLRGYTTAMPVRTILPMFFWAVNNTVDKLSARDPHVFENEFDFSLE
jgi:hypothetical protein